MNTSGKVEPRILRMPAVLDLTGVSRVTIWRYVKAGTFPQPLRLGGPKGRAVGWRRSDVIAWIEALEPAVDAVKR